jgi:uncharacterized protein (DUF2236 family)
MSTLELPGPLQQRVEAWVHAMMRPPGMLPENFAEPSGESALSPPDSMSWQLFKNPATLFIGGVAAVIL